MVVDDVEHLEDGLVAGSTGAQHLNAAVVGLAPTPDGHGYWEVAADGGVFGYGDAGYYGSLGGAPRLGPVTGIAGSASGHGYWEVAADGGVFGYGDAGFYGSLGGAYAARRVATNGPLGLPSPWSCIAQHESGGDPSTNTGNGYFGLFQFSIASWRAAGVHPACRATAPRPSSSRSPRTFRLGRGRARGPCRHGSVESDG